MGSPDRSNPELVTPSGYRVTFRPFLTTAGYRAVQRVIASYVTISRDGLQEDTLNAVATISAQDETLKQMVLGVTAPDGTDAPDPIAAIGELPRHDGDAVYDRLDELTRDDAETAEGDDGPKADASPGSASS